MEMRSPAAWRKLLPGRGFKRALARQLVSSLTIKFLGIFLAIFLVALAPLVVSYWNDVKTHRIETLATRLELIAEQSTKRIDPELAASVRLHADTGGAGHRRLSEVLHEIELEFDVDNAVLMRRVDDGSFRYIADGGGQFDVEQPVFIHETFPETLSAAVRAWEDLGRRHTELFGFGRFEYLQFNKPILRDGQVVALLLLNTFAEDVDQAIKHDTLRLVLLSLGLFLLGALVFWLVSRRLLRPLVELKRAANRLAAGELDLELRPVPGHDEVARLSASFAAMVVELRQGRAALEQRNAELQRTLTRVQLMEDLEKNLFKLVPRAVRTVLRSDPAALERGKTERDVTVLFLDVENSTRLSQAMEAAQVDRLIEGYFSQYLDCIYENQGDVTETAGDGLMIIFQGGEPATHAYNAVKTALAIQAATRKICLADPVMSECLRVNIGINSGPALVGFTRYEAVSGERVTFTASGLTTIVAARLQHLATGGDVYVSDETMRRIAGLAAWRQQGVQVEALGELALKNLNRAERVYRLLLDTDAPRPPTGSRAAG